MGDTYRVCGEKNFFSYNFTHKDNYVLKAVKVRPCGFYEKNLQTLYRSLVFFS